MTWQQPQLTDPPMGPTDEIKRLQHLLIHAYPRNSKAIELGVQETGIFDERTDRALRNVQPFCTPPQPVTGILTYATKVALGVIAPPPKAPTKRFVQQGVGFSTDAFLMGNPTHSYVDARNEGTAETLRLALPLVGTPKVLIGYSMGDDIMNRVLLAWPVDRRDEIKLAIGFGCPSRAPGATLLGNNPPGVGISGVYTPDWARDRTYQFVNDGDMYGCAVGVLPQLYEILTRMEATMDFAMYLFNMLTSSFGPILLGLAGTMIPGFGALTGILSMITSGPLNTNPAQDTSQINLMAMITNIPAIIATIVAALKFVSTNAHYHYHDQPRPYWRGLTAVDCAAQIIADKVREATVYTIPGTVSWWNDGPPAWTAWKLP